MIKLVLKWNHLEDSTSFSRKNVIGSHKLGSDASVSQIAARWWKVIHILIGPQQADKIKPLVPPFTLSKNLLLWINNSCSTKTHVEVDTEATSLEVAGYAQLRKWHP